MKQLLPIILFFLCAFPVQASSLKACEPYKKDSYGNLHISYSKEKGEEAKLKACFEKLKGFHVAVYFEHPLALTHIYTKRLQAHKFQIYDVNNETKTITWLWRNGRTIPDRWTTETAVRIVVKNKDGKILLIKSRGISWLLVPGGGVDKGLLARDEAVRNLAQEIGITAQPKDLKLVALLNRTNVYGYKGLNEVVYIFALNQYEGKPTTSADAEKLYWVTPEEIKQGVIDGIKVHPFAAPLVDQTAEATAKKGYMRLPDHLDKKSKNQHMMDVEFIG